MNYNILSYGLYAIITIYIIVWVGKAFHRNGRMFILSLFENNEVTTDTTNNLLLVGYYLFNIGYAILQFSFWQQINNMQELILNISIKLGILVLILAALHYNNMFIIYLLSKNKKQSLKKL